MSEIEGLRPCLLAPIPELSEAVDLLSQAVDGLLAGDEDLARDRIRRADVPVIHAWASRIMGSVDDEIHRYRPAAGLAAPVTRVVQRMPGISAQAAIYARDGYRCRFCGCRVVLPTVRPAMTARLPDSIRWGSTNVERHAAFFALTATIDHLVPHAKGGGNDPENLLTTCQACNFGRSDWLIEEVGLIDPRGRPPIIDDWDGLMRLTVPKRRSARPGSAIPTDQAEHVAVASTPSPATEGHAGWFSDMDRALGTPSMRLLALLEDCRELQVSWTLGKVLLVKVSMGDRMLDVFGIEPDGDVQIPWSIGDEKDRFRGFAAILAAAIPGAIAYETPRMWRVGRRGGRISVLDILDASDAVRAALRELNEALRT
ncbi:HNH endonuclease [Inquilinus sp. CA228]|uniref:HNH endonuclease n=1 Tax=Inquilinus sp. CA228 TaxID=3455609 RepID=UPI003F8CFC45